MNEREKWDLAASDFQRVFRLGLSDYNTALLRFWLERGMLFPGAHVIDIGCGVGRYGTYFAELGCNVTLIDISGEMLRHAGANMAKFKTPWSVHCCDFNTVTGKEPAFAGGFDFAVSTMSPAVHDAATVRKMSGMTRRWCFLARFSDWEQPFRDRLMRELGMKPRRLFDDLKADCASMMQAVCEAGYIPQTRQADYRWSDARTPEQMAEYMYRNYFAEDEDRDELYRRALKLAKDLAGEESTVADHVNAKVMWIFWNTKDKRI